jgi:SAM-dependent methyltransferase
MSPTSTGPATRDVRTAVAEQYERYPFPPRDPADEAQRLVVTTLGDLPRAADLLWAGRRELATLRVLDAGCGTGDSAVYMAQQARAAQVVALDASRPSLEVTRARAHVRGLDNVELVHASILDLPRLGLAPFDYVVCSGVLHHLPDPLAGLRALVSVLQPAGGLGLMLYARHGRAPVYQVQDLLRRLGGDDPLEARVAMAGEVLSILSDQHLFKAARLEDQMLDLSVYGGAGIVDLLLHACDQAYTVSEIYDLLASASLELLSFHRPVLYRPEGYPLTEGLRARVAELTAPEREAVAELLHGRMIKHELYAARRGTATTVPAAADAPAAVRPRVYEPALATYFQGLRPIAQPFHLTSTEGFTITLELTPTECALLSAIDGRRTLDAVFDRATAVMLTVGVRAPRIELEVAWRRVAPELQMAGFLGYALAE